MGQQIGNVRGGIICDVELQVKAEEIGDVLSIYFAQPSDSTASWKLQVACGSDQALEIMGQVVTVPPGVAGEPPSRMVAVAYGPGAKRWRVSCSTADPREGARISLSSSRQASGLGPGVTAVKNGTQNPTGNKVRFDSGDVQTAMIVGASVGSTLWEVEGTLSSADLAGAATYVLLFDQLLAPAGGDVPIWGTHVGQVAGASPDPSSYHYSPDGGLLVQNQLWIATSLGLDPYGPDLPHLVTVHAILGTQG